MYSFSVICYEVAPMRLGCGSQLQNRQPRANHGARLVMSSYKFHKTSTHLFGRAFPALFRAFQLKSGEHGAQERRPLLRRRDRHDYA